MFGARADGRQSAGGPAVATAHPQSRFHDDFTLETPQRREVRSVVPPVSMPPWARRLALSMCLIHVVTIIAGLFLGGLYLALGAFGVVMLGAGAALLYTYRDRSGKAETTTNPRVT